MAFRCYLAMTAEEISHCAQLPALPGWMACHFSNYGTGLSNLPRQLPPGAMVILNDRTPFQGHDPGRITDQLLQLCQTLSPGCILLDLQRPGVPQIPVLVQQLTKALPCPVGISSLYARDCPGAVFLPPCPICTPLKEHIAQWSQRELWLDIATQAQKVTVDTEGSSFEDVPLYDLPEPVFIHEELCCRYHIDIGEDHAIFHLQRCQEQLKGLLVQAESLGIRQCIGLYQQLGDFSVT